MKAAILTDRADSFPKPLAQGLERMFKQIGVEPVVLYEGLSSLPKAPTPPAGGNQTLKSKLRRFAKKWDHRLAYRRLLSTLRHVDFAVIIGHAPAAYYESFFDDQRLRRDLPHLPIVLYDLVYLGSATWWAPRIAAHDPTVGVPPGKHLGLDRYDYHLCVTEVNGEPIAQGCGAFSRIGINLIDPSLVIEEPKEFIALIDFERPDYLHERSVQVAACIEAGIPFKVLHGQYKMEEIRRIYRRCSAYFVAHTESFGLPICEVQACGATVLTPYARWCPAHYLPQNKNGTWPLPENFVVYNNDKNLLVRELKRLKETHDAKKNLARFQREQPQFHTGDVTALKEFIRQIETGSINAHSRSQYPGLQVMVEHMKNQRWL